MNQRRNHATESLVFAVAVTAAVVLVIALTRYVPWKLDWTKNSRFSLADSSERLVSELEDPLEVTAYFTANLPPPLNETEQNVRDLLAEYENASGGMVDVRFISPESEDEQEEAQKAGVQSVSHRVVRENGFVAEQGFRGLVLEYLDRKETIPVVQSAAGLEYSITTKIKQLVGERTPIGILTGLDGPTPSQGIGKIQECLPTYEIKEVAADESLKPEDLQALLVIEPHTALSPTVLGHLNRFVMEGGNLGVFGPNIKLEQPPQNPQMPMQMPPNLVGHDSGVNQLLRPWGVVVGEGVVLDRRAVDSWPAEANFMGQRIQTAVIHPPAVIGFFDDAQQEHPAAFGLDNAYQPFTSPLELTSEAAAGVERVVLLNSSEQGWVGNDTDITLMGKVDGRQWQQSSQQATQYGPTPMVIALEGKLKSAFSGGSTPVEAPTEAAETRRVLVNGSSFFLRDMWAGNRGCEEAPELIFFANAVDWLAQDQDLIAIRAKTVEDPKINVPQNITDAESKARSAAEAAQEAAQEEFVASRTGDAKKQAEAASERDQARSEVDKALEAREQAVESWKMKKVFYQYGNMLGVPLLFALFGVLWWQRRKNAKANIEL